MSTRTELVKLAVERYPCGALPRGALTLLAAEVGVTRERVRQVLRVESEMPFLRKPPRLCKKCGVPAEAGSPLCLDCSHPFVACVACGNLTRKSLGRILEAAKGAATRVPGDRAAVRTGRFFCDRRCFGTWVGRGNGGRGRQHES